MFIEVTLPSTGQTPKQQLLKKEIQKDSQQLKVGGEGNETHVCMAFNGCYDFCQYCTHGRHLSDVISSLQKNTLAKKEVL